MYFIFFNPETKEVIIDDILSNELVQGKKPSIPMPGVNVPLMDYQNKKFEEVFIICVLEENMMLPTFAFLNKDSAVAHMGQSDSTSWNALYSKNKSEAPMSQSNQTIFHAKIKCTESRF
ncbi:MAG: hypothetical protein ACW9W3_06460 [Candidatus Nitrosopumilus sp. bin_68KS]